MDVIAFVIGIFFLWKGQMQLESKSKPWPKNKRNGRIIGGLLLLPFIIEELFIFFGH